VGYPGRVPRDDDTAPIDLSSGRRRSFKRAVTTPEEDAPHPGESIRSPSALIEDAFKASAEIGRAVDRGETPTSEQLKRMNDGALVFRVLRDRLLDAASGGGGGGPRNGWLPVVAAVLASLGITIGGPSLTSADDIAEAKIMAAQTAVDVSELEERQAKLEKAEADKERAMRRNLGLTIRWLGDEQTRHCKNNEAIAEGLNWLVKRELSRDKRVGDGEIEPIKINCDASVLIPPELDGLRAEARYDQQ
jgi:hypothetical protein